MTTETKPIRALTLFETLPPDHKTFRVPDDGSSPHLKEREFAVIDTTDREPQHGELFLKQESGHSRPRQIVQVKAGMCQITETGPESPVWWLSDLAGFRQIGDTAGIPLFAGLSYGPYDAAEQYLQTQFIGRVVGYAVNSFGEAIAPEAGWENEEEGNAAFDPAEYLDVMIGAGYEPSVFRRPDGTFGYREMFPEDSLSDAQRAECHAAQARFCASSEAADRVKAECLRRGLVE
jgi:hypothetical protein